METTIFNVSRPNQEPAEGDWVRAITLDGDGAFFAVVEYEFHEEVKP